jgi:hypothetical protein
MGSTGQEELNSFKDQSSMMKNLQFLLNIGQGYQLVIKKKIGFSYPYRIFEFGVKPTD